MTARHSKAYRLPSPQTVPQSQQSIGPSLSIPVLGFWTFFQTFLGLGGLFWTFSRDLFVAFSGPRKPLLGLFSASRPFPSLFWASGASSAPFLGFWAFSHLFWASASSGPFLGSGPFPSLFRASGPLLGLFWV